MASISSVKKIRFRRSGIRKTLATASKNFICAYLDPQRASRLASDYFSTSPSLLDFIQSRFRKYMRMDCKLPGHISRSEHFQSGPQLLDHAELQQTARIESIAFQRFQAPDIYDSVFLAKNIFETALGQAAMQRHLAAFEPAHYAVAGNGPGTLGAAPGILATAGAHALPNPLPLLLLALRRSEIAEIHFSP